MQQSKEALGWTWNFGDGSGDIKTTAYSETHTYTSIGTFLVTLIAIDSNTCNVSDTVYKNITVQNNESYLDFRYDKTNRADCNSLSFDFFNTSTAPSPARPFKDSSFVWVFSDNPTPVVTSPVGQSDTHSFPAPGTYNVSLILVDTGYCNYPDTLTKQLFIAANVKAQFETPAIGCAPYTAVINNTSIAGQQYYWDFGDGGPGSTDRTPAPHFYPNPGTYTISLKVVDSTTCNIVDSTQETITLQGKPTPVFDFTPLPPVPNTPTVFTNSSIGGIRYEWIFGDGSSTVKLTMEQLVQKLGGGGLVDLREWT